ncbi:MAG: LamG domain-containing protein [Archaeoglobus sp.]|uniref:LamG domain-containing protein n=1 Tax=Archaeoglobus sp. TaxID=1872626 RepID=UPI001D4A88A3|nr:LamG domain-containing protein [Archaeoglobus sp.]MBO8179875.1 LamG domain-containing protein [Archaeoglobus sp.]
MWSSSEVGEHSVEITVNDSVDTVEIGTWTLYEDDDYSCTFYVDNVKFVDVVEDDSGNGNDGTIYGATSVEGRYGYGLSFDGEDDYVNAAVNLTAIDYENKSLTIAGWVYIEDTTQWAGLFGIPYVWEWSFGVSQAGDDLYIAVRSPVSTIRIPGVFTKPGWYFIVGVWHEDTKTVDAYVNGELVTTWKPDGEPTIKREAFVIGRWGDRNDGSRHLKGIVDEVRFYTRDLTATEQKSMYEALRVKFYDESGEKIAANATVFNANYSIDLTTDEVTKEAVLFNADLPAPGNYWVKTDGSVYRQILVSLGNGLVERSMWLPSENVVQVVFSLVDYTGQFGNAILVLKKLMGSNLETIHEDEFDAFGDVSTYLTAGQRYQICVRNDQEERIIGWFVPSMSETKILEIRNPTIEQPMWVDVNWAFSFNRSVGADNTTTDSVGLIYTDKLGQTTLVRFWVYDMKGNQLYYSESTESNASFVYATTDVKEAYKAVFEAEHAKYGTISDFKVFRPGAALSTQLFDQIVTSFMPVIASKNLDLAYNLMSCFVLLAVGGLFSYKNRTVGVAVFAGMAMLLYWFGLLRIPSIIVATIVVYAALVRIGGGGR